MAPDSEPLLLGGSSGKALVCRPLVRLADLSQSLVAVLS